MGAGLAGVSERMLVAGTRGSVEACELVLTEVVMMWSSLRWLVEADSAAESRVLRAVGEVMWETA